MAYEEEDAALPYATIGTDEAKKMIDSGVKLIDVRTPEEWNRGHIESAELVTINGIYSFGKALEDLQLSQDEDVIFVCASGGRSATASEIASLVGLHKVYNLANGMNGWVNRKYPVVR